MADYFHNPTVAVSFSKVKMNKVNLYESSRLFCDVYCLLPGQTQAIHSHAHNDKVYYTLTGTCKVTVGEETLPLEPGNIAIAPAGVTHGVENASDQPATLLVMMAPHPNFTH